MAIDLSVPLEEATPVFPNHPPFDHEDIVSYEEAGAVVKYFSMSAHQGTHIDAPSHFIEDGKTIDELSLELFVGPAYVVDLRHKQGDPITADVLADTVPDLDETTRVILITGDMDAYFYDEDFFEKAAHITVDGAEWLVDNGVSVVGNDFLTEAVPGDPDRPVHHTLLGAEIPVVEYLYNTESLVDHDLVEFISLPLYIPGFEAAPTRAIAREYP